MKYFVFAIDDGTIFDKKVISIFNKYGIKATFNLNSGLQDFVWFKDWLEVRRLKLEENKNIYNGHEVASHSLTHPFLTSLSDEDVYREVNEDINNLRNIFHLDIKTFSSAGLPKSSFAAIKPPTITEAEEPKPLETGICVFIVIFSSFGICPIKLYKSSIAL